MRHLTVGAPPRVAGPMPARVLLVLSGACALFRASAGEQVLPEPSSREPAREHEITLEYRRTDIFDEPPAPLLGPPPEAVWFVSDEMRASPSNHLVFVAEGLLFDEEADKQRIGLNWGRRTASKNSRVWLGLSYLWNGAGADGFATSAELSSRAGPNLDWLLGAQIIRGLDESWGARVRVRLDAVLSRSTALRARAWLFRDWQAGSSAGVAEVRLARHLGRGAALHALLRANSSEAVGSRRSAVGSVELRKELGRTLVRLSCRWYGDAAGVGAWGPSAGVEREFDWGSAGVNYRFYETNEGLQAGTWWVALRFAM